MVYGAKFMAHLVLKRGRSDRAECIEGLYRAYEGVAEGYLESHETK